MEYPVISNYGFVVLKSKLKNEQIIKLKRDLNVTPHSTFGNFKAKYFKVYYETKTQYVLPIYYAINELNLTEYTVDFKESDPVDLKGKDIITLRPNQIECFNTCIQEFDKPFGGGIINMSTGGGKCHGINTPIIMYDGSIKMIQDINVGEFLMGDDSSKRTVLSLARGNEELFEIKPIKGDSYIVNKSHILSLKNVINLYDCKSSYCIKWFCLKDKKVKCKSLLKKKYTYEQVLEFKNNIKKEFGIVDINLQEYLKLTKSQKHILKGYKVPINFPVKQVPLDPYMIGFWLGDGTNACAQITTQDSIILHYFRKNLKSLNLMLSHNNKYSYNITNNRKPIYKGTCNLCNIILENKYRDYYFCTEICCKIYKKGIFNKTLQDYNLINNKHIPDIYKYNSRENRLKLLAGLIDSDGNLKKNGGFEFSQKNEKLMDDVVYLCRSLGFSCYKNIKKTSWTYKGIKKYGTTFIICISGSGIEQIPTLCIRKQSAPRKQKKDVLCYGFNVIPKDLGNYYGFELDSNKRYMLGDFSVTHNTATAIKIISNLPYKTLVVVNKVELMEQWKRELKKFIPGIKIGIIQGSKFEYENVDIVLGMLQTITLKKELCPIDFSWSNMLIIDEIHNVGSEVFSKILFKVRPRYVFGLTATLERKDKLEKIIKWYVGDIIYSNINEELKQSTEIHLYTYTGESSVEKLLYDNTTKAVAEMITNIGNDNQRSNLIISILNNLLNANSSRNILVISDRISQLKYIYSKLEPGTAGLFIGSMKNEELEKTKEKRVILATFGIANEGFSLEKLNCLVFATPRSSIVQAIGRIYRKKHEITPIIVDIIDDFSIFKSQQYKRKKIYKESIDNYVFVYKNSTEIKEEIKELSEFAFLDI